MTRLDRTISDNLAILLSTVPRVRDGESDAIHNARVATRRLRAALPLAWAESPKTAWRDGAEAVRHLGRDLGRVREVDVALERLPALESRIPPFAASIAVIRQELTGRQAKQHRRLVKSLDELPIDTLEPDRLVPRSRVSLREDPRWRAVERALVEHAQRLHQSIHHASGVYFPNRIHRVRVETKKLRYVLELMTHSDAARSAIKRLKRIQRVLGDVHDQQLLLETVRDTAVIRRRERDDIVASIEGRCHELFQDYLADRAPLLELCETVRRAALRQSWRPVTVGDVLLTAGAVAVSPVLLWLTRPAGVNIREPRPDVARRSVERQPATDLEAAVR